MPLAIVALLSVMLAVDAFAHVGDQDAAAPSQQPAAQFIETWCVHCHSGAKPKGKLDFEPIVARIKSNALTPADRSVLRDARDLVRTAEMPPPEAEDRPSAEESARGSEVLREVVRTHGLLPAPVGGVPRRLNRTEYTNAIRDLLAIDVAPLGTLPPDEIGAGFDNVASVLSLSPGALERYIELAEAIANGACPEVDLQTPPARSFAGEDLHIPEKAGRANERGATLWSNGEASIQTTFARTGVYSMRVRVAAQQAGPEPVKIAIAVDGKPVAYFDIAEATNTTATRTADVRVEGGSHKVGVMFLNDFYLKDGPDGKSQDRNVIVQGLEVVGPIDAQKIPIWQSVMREELDLSPSTSHGERERAEFRWLIATVLRRPATGKDLQTLDAALKPLKKSAPREIRLRGALTTLLSHPEFLFRIERDPKAGESERALDDFELATRLAAFLWASVPDAPLRHAAKDGLLTDDSQRTSVIESMLADARASRLAVRFAAQWLQIDDIETRTPDATRFPKIDEELLASMRAESVMLFDSLLREHRPVSELLDADYTFVDARLANHYGMSAPPTSGMQRVPVDPVRGGGVIAHASVLLATSNPSRTSPVKRGKWVLEAMLDAAPPPPPPGTAQLPPEAEDPSGKTMRQSLEAHRADPNCAACHRRMDALGFALEQWDAVGRHRAASSATPIDDHGDLPDGRSVIGLAGLRETLVGDPAFLRSLIKHLLIYATGREQSERDEAIIDELVEDLGANPTLHDIVIAVAQSRSMRFRGVP